MTHQQLMDNHPNLFLAIYNSAINHHNVLGCISTIRDISEYEERVLLSNQAKDDMIKDMQEASEHNEDTEWDEYIANREPLI